MKIPDLGAKIRKLPAKQQVGLWVILDRFHKKKGTWFTVAEFAGEMEKYLLPKDPERLGQILGGVLGGLVRNGMVKQLAGGQKPVWTVIPELHDNAKKFKDSIFPVIAYWEGINRS